jgi:multidrug efflux pump subunit AcrA (membrane-fusion protein)
MTCTIDLTVKELPAALTVPASAVFSEDGQSFVYVAGGADQHERHAVVGEKIGKLFVIQQGVDAGTKVLAEQPEKES